MAELGMIAAVVSVLDAATKLVKDVVSTTKRTKNAELQGQIGELMLCIADAKSKMARVELELGEKEKEIRRLEEALENKKKLTRRSGVYYYMDENKEPYGEPFCSHCWDAQTRLIHIVRAGPSYDSTACPACKQKYARSDIQLLIEKKRP